MGAQLKREDVVAFDKFLYGWEAAKFGSAGQRYVVRSGAGKHVKLSTMEGTLVTDRTGAPELVDPDFLVKDEFLTALRHARRG